MSRVLITGGAGFIGYHLAKRISSDSVNEITLADNMSRGEIDSEFNGILMRKNVRLERGDLTDPKFFTQLDKDYEYIYHLAAIIGVKNVMEHPDKVLSVNAVSTLNLFDYARSIKGLKRIFFSSTSEVYAGTLKHFGIKVPTDENVALAIEDISVPRTSYALSKIYGESTGLVYGIKYGIPVTIGRYHNIYGPRMGFWHVIPETFMKIHNSATIGVPSPGHTRAFCFIDDAVELTIRACENKNTLNEVVNIGNSKEEISIKDLVMKIAKIMGKKVVIKELPDTIGSPARRCPDTSKIERLTGYAAAVSLEDGIRKTYGWYKERIGVLSNESKYMKDAT